MNSVLFYVVSVHLAFVTGQICNNRDPSSGGLFIPAFGHGSAMAKMCTGSSNCSEILYCKTNATTDAPVDGCSPPPNDPQAAMSVAYVVSLLYSFLGISIIADVFMASIDVIASSTKIVQTRDKETGQMKQTQVMIWNVTVANLTLMALGTSAPEILLSLIEILSESFYEGKLGPGAIVGSAAFNLMVITAVCMMAIPPPNIETGETGFRKVSMIQVFLTTTFYSIFAYAWLLVILVVSSPDKVDIWEAAVTFALYPIMVITSWCVDKREESMKKTKYSGLLSKSKLSTSEVENLLSNDHVRDLSVEEATALTEFRQFQHSRKSQVYFRREGVALMAGKRSQIPNAPEKPQHSSSEKHNTIGFDSESYMFLEDAGDATAVVRRTGDLSQEVVVEYTLHSGQHGFSASLGDDIGIQRYGVPSSAASSSSSESTPLLQEEKKDTLEMVPLQTRYPMTKTSKAKSVNTVDDVFVMMGVNLMIILMTMPRNAPASSRLFMTFMGLVALAGGYKRYGSNFVPKLKKRFKQRQLAKVQDKSMQGASREIHGRLVFKPMEREKIIAIPIYDDDEFEHDELFDIQLSAPSPPNITRLGIARTSIRVVDDDVGFSPGIVEMMMTRTGEVQYIVAESIGHVSIKVVRRDGARGECSVDYETVAGTATADRDFIYKKGTLTFKHGQTSRFIEVDILDDQRFEKKEKFQVILSNPQACSLGDLVCANVSITDDDYMHALSDKIASQLNLNVDKWETYANQWSDQFSEACEVPEGCAAQFMHLLSIPLKFAFAFCPPPRMLGGWPCYFASFTMIGIMTVVVADLASLFGCSVGLKDEVTAITVVAMGTSLPDLFSAKIVAIMDKTADNSVGKVTGSNSVNIFLGLGLPWLIAAVYWEIVGPTPKWIARYPELSKTYPEGGFIVRAGSLAFTVAVFFGTCIISLAIIFYRRKVFGAELGGSGSAFWATILIFLWLLYLTISCLQIYEVIDV